MISCCFFGHRDTPEEVKFKIEEVIIDLIENNNIKLFYVGNNGNFDYMVENILKKLKEKYPHIVYYVVLAYIPTHNTEFDLNDKQTRIIRTCLKRHNFGAFRFVIVCRR